MEERDGRRAIRDVRYLISHKEYFNLRETRERIGCSRNEISASLSGIIADGGETRRVSKFRDDHR